MNIALVHGSRVPPLKYGGTERIVFWLGQALLQLGHQVTLIAPRGSTLPGATVLQIDETRPDAWHDQLAPEIEVVHVFSTPGRRPKRPFLVTIQGNGKPGELFDPNTVFISRAHARNHLSEHFVYNGINPDDYPCETRRTDALVFLAKASWKVKNLQGAIELARATSRPLEVLGSRDWPLRLHRLLPAWSGVRYRGMVGDREKREVLRSASALLFPVRWPEPFGIALTEAMASGCFVLGTPYGSLPEIVSHDTGVLSADAEVLLDALRNRQFSPAACRARVVEHFSHLGMARAYLEHYRTVIERGTLATQPPRAQFAVPAETLLEYRYLR